MTTALQIAVCGCGNAGMAIAADCALMGKHVSLFEIERMADQLKPVQAAGGIEVTATSQTISGRTGFAALSAATTDAAKAVAGADLVMITVPAMYHGVFVDALAPHLCAGQIVLFNTAYWGCLRHAARLHGSGIRVTLAETNTMPYAAQRDRGNGVHISRYKRYFRVAALPGEASGHVFDVLRQIYPQVNQVPTVLDIDIASGGNPAMTAPMAIPVAGYFFDRFMGGKMYAEATKLGCRLLEAYDADRKRLAQHLGSQCFESQLEYYAKAYGSHGDDMAQIMRKSDLIDWYATSDYIEQLIDEDLPYAYVPMVRLAEALGIELPGIRAMVDLLGIMLGKDYWSRGAGLAELGLAGLNLDQVKKLAMTGHPGS